MNSSTFLEGVISRLEDLTSRARNHASTLSDNQLNWPAGKDNWSIGQIYEHLRLANSKYVPAMDEAVANSRFGREEAEVKHTLFGGMIARAAGPGTNVPAHPAMVPTSRTYDNSGIEHFIQEHQHLLELAKSARGTDLRYPIRNPYMKLMKMNLADCFAIVTGHAERHIGQIEQLMRRPDFPA